MIKVADDHHISCLAKPEMRVEMKLTSRRISDILRDYFAFQCKMAKGLHAVVVDDRTSIRLCPK